MNNSRLSNEKWEILMNAGLYNETENFSCKSYDEAKLFIQKNFNKKQTNKQTKELNLDITEMAQLNIGVNLTHGAAMKSGPIYHYEASLLSIAIPQLKWVNLLFYL
ncbi:hypothetical protein [Marinomonas algicola]|uniref:hypothetical protein n=1 Tax=Marinomonas algicola TaxID=2773454 RepID=UPI001749CD74|nr:hypothetical protein [Marinomonas algicola]